MRARLFMFRTFRSRILALVLGLVTVVLSATVVAVVVQARTEVTQQATLQLQSAADKAREMMRFRGDQLSSAAEVLMADFGFKEAVSTADTPTLVSAIGNHGARIGADAVIVFDTKGRLIASTLGVLSPETQNDLQALVAGQSDRELLRFYHLIEGRPYQIVLAPVLAPDPIGWTVIAFRLDDKLATDMARLLGVDVSFVTGGLDSSVNVSSSLAANRRAALASAAGAPMGRTFFVNTAGDQFLTWTNAIRAKNGRITLVLQRSMTEALRPYQLMRQSILGIGALALAAAWLFCVLLARSATRPIEALIQAAERLQAGDYSAELPRTSTTELSRLASAFDAMRMAVADREATIRHQALHDGLTRLPTLTRISEILQVLLLHSGSRAQPVTVCLVEIQQFQDIIASLGHAAGDEVLWEVARRLTDAQSSNESVARIATDRFLVVCDTVGAKQARAKANAIAGQLGAPFDYSGVSLQLAIRVGVATFPEDGELPSELLQRAELALYRAAESGVGVGVYVRGDDESHRDRMAILGQLRHAIASDQLQIYYQPKVTASGGCVVGCEALVRWHHPERGFIPPGDFIPHAERTGMIRFLTAWVVSSTLRQLRCWQDAGLGLDVAINVSPTDLADPGFVQALTAQLAQTGADPAHLVLEVTESAAMKDLPNTLRVMDSLRVLGIRFAIDDFGTGYSSLAHLKRLPVDEIKIDRSFIQELEARPEDDVIVRSTINLGHALGLKVVAEGVEQADSFNSLARFDCDLIQGYFVSKPMPAAEFTSWVTERMQSQRPRGWLQEKLKAS
jgi:diguanylate cyclase